MAVTTMTVASVEDGSDETNAPSWSSLERQYHRGVAALNVVAVPVAQPSEPAATLERSASRTSNGTSVGAKHAREVYEEKGYLPALPNPREYERQRVLRRFDLHQARPQGGIRSIDDIARLAQDVFGVETVIVNAVLEDKTFFVSSAGWTEEPHAQVEMPIDVSFCPHAMTKPADAACFVVPDATKEWRFRQNPLVQTERPIRFFASANINMPKVDYSNPDEAERLPIGSLCLVNPTPRAPLDDKEEQMLKRMANMVAKEIELSFQIERQKLYDTRLDFVSTLFRKLIVHPSRAMNTPSPVNALPCAISGLSDTLRALTYSDFAFVLDIRDLNTAEQVQEGAGRGRLGLLDCACPPMCANDEVAQAAWKARLCGEEGLHAVSRALANWHEDEQITFTQPITGDGSVGRLATPLAAFLPPETSAAIACPLFDHQGAPSLLIVVGSLQRHFQFEPSDQRFIRNVGGVLIAGMLQEKILLSDQAKLRFVGHVSHELRTPIFAVGSQLELIRDLAGPEALTTINPLLDVAETCLTSLREILDDTLDYTKLQNRSADTVDELSLVRPDDLLVDVVHACHTKTRRLASMHAEYAPGEKDVIFKSSVPENLRAKVDVGGLKRVLINLLANAIKFTNQGTITLTASVDDPVPQNGSRPFFRFECSDTGRGMTADFVRDHLYVPFKQSDPFAPGAGLGTSIADNIVRRMGGTLRYNSTLGKGTTALVRVPLEVVIDPAGSSSPRSVVRNLSGELEALCTPRASRSTSPVTPNFPRTCKTGTVAGMTTATVSSRGPADGFRDAGTPGQGAGIASVKIEKAVVLEAPPPRKAKTAPAALAHSELLKLLVVDDNPIARKIYCTWLKNKGIAFIEAADGQEAVAQFRLHRPNVVWCDVQMPRMDGVEAAMLMRQCEAADSLARARIIAVSGLDSSHGQHATVVKNGTVDRWLVKTGRTLRDLGADLLLFAESLAQRRDSQPAA